MIHSFLIDYMDEISKMTEDEVLKFWYDYTKFQGNMNSSVTGLFETMSFNMQDHLTYGRNENSVSIAIVRAK